MVKILVTSAGSVNGINVIKALKGKYYVVACDSNSLSAGLYLADKHYVITHSDDHYGYRGDIRDICLMENIQIVIPTHSSELGVLALEEDNFFEKQGIKMMLCSYNTYDTTENKVMCHAFLKNIGVLTPKLYSKKFPVIIKPIIGSGSKGINIAKNQTELDFYSVKDTFYEEFIEGREYTIDGVCDLHANMICALPRIRVKTYGGLAVKSTTVQNDELVQLARKISESLCVRGAFNIQCIEKDGKYYVTDVNIRFPSGGLPLDVASGMNTPEIIIKLLQGEKVKPKLEYGKTMLRYWDSVII